MRLISVANAAPGMVLASPVYDLRGTPVLAERETLTEASMPLLAGAVSSELVIQDPRTDDIFVDSVFTADIDARAIQALTHLLGTMDPARPAIPRGGLVGIAHPVSRFVTAVHPYITGEPAIAGSYTLDGYHYIHPVRVAQLALVIGAHTGLSATDLTNLGLAAMLMNVGYATLQADMLDQPRDLTPDERAALHNHPRASLEMLAASGLERETFLAIAQHHERWDGSGYPAQRRGEEICHAARILAVADTYIALRSRRPHRPAFRPHEAVEFIIAFAGALFEPELAQTLMRQIPQYPAGVGVVLSSGESGVVANPNVGHVARPVVRVFAVDGTHVRKTYDIDLTAREHQQKVIVQVDL
jgi:HD-GYP domain-containing protein (c-di-GMP phosphodiesterase class II)